MIWNTFVVALQEIRRNLLRSGLTVLGVVIGVAAVITMVTLGNGAKQSIADQISSLGSNLIIVRPGQGSGPTAAASGAAPFELEDAEQIREQIPGVAAVAPTASRPVTLVRMAENWFSNVVGADNEYFRAGSWELEAGRLFSTAELRSGQAVCVVGETVRRELFGAENPIDGEIRVGHFSCRVVGWLRSKGQAALGNDQDDIVVMPLVAVQRRLTGSTSVSLIYASVHDGVSLDRTKDAIVRLMRERRQIGGAENDDFSVVDTKQIAEILSGTIGLMTALLGAVAAVSLLVGGIGIMNIMLVSVTERTREIGIRLAIGALEREVMLQFLIESIVLSCLGGLAGVVLATSASVGLAGLLGVPFLFDPEITLLSFGFSAAIGVLFGYFPALRAARLDPIEALRHE